MGINTAIIGSEVYKMIQGHKEAQAKSIASYQHALSAKEKARIALEAFELIKKQMKEALDSGNQLEEVLMLRVDPVTGETYDTAADMFAASQTRTTQQLEHLRAQMEEGLKAIDRVVHIDDFIPADDDGTDQTQYFEQALGEGNVHLKCGSKKYRAAIKAPSNTIIEGEGKGLTTIQLPDNASAGEWVITNNDYKNGNSNIVIKGMTLDWNKVRLSVSGDSVPSGQVSSCLALAKVHFGWIKDVEAIGAGLHAIDITCPIYPTHPVNADSDYTADGSRFIWVDNCHARGYGDDGISTHYSEYIWISNCTATDPDGGRHREGAANTNGIEIDDGSKNVWVRDCYTSGNVRGVEVKAHAEYPAAQHVTISNHVSYRDCRSYDLRHIGHHLKGDPNSTTAFDVSLVNCTAIEPRWNDLYDRLSPATLVISAYRNVKVNNFTQIGDPEYDYGGHAMARMQYKSANVSINGFKSRGFKSAEFDIAVVGGDQHADRVKVADFDILDSAPVGVQAGGGVMHVSISSGDIVSTDGTGVTGIVTANNQAHINAVNVEGFAKKADIAGRVYVDQTPTILRGGSVISSSTGAAYTPTGAIAASTGSCEAKGDRNFIAACSGGSSTEGSRSAVIASNNCHVRGRGNREPLARVILASGEIESSKGYTVTGGYEDRKWELDSMSGDITAAGALNQGGAVGDYAEWFESVDGSAIEAGHIVTLQGDMEWQH